MAVKVEERTPKFRLEQVAGPITTTQDVAEILGLTFVKMLRRIRSKHAKREPFLTLYIESMLVRGGWVNSNNSKHVFDMRWNDNWKMKAVNGPEISKTQPPLFDIFDDERQITDCRFNAEEAQKFLSMCRRQAM